jgi:predicted nuclease of restriction endonuclease-like RecB superfamily
MLTADLIRPRVRRRGGKIFTRPLPLDSLTTQQTAADLIGIFREHLQRPRWALDEALEAYEGVRVDYPLIRGLAKVLRDGATFAAHPPVEPSTLRAALFDLAARRGPVTAAPNDLYPTGRGELIAEVAARYGLSPDDVDQNLYADLIEEQILVDLGMAWTPDALIVRYNLELARGLLYWASEMRITVRGGYKDLFKFIKLFKLMHTITPIPGGYYIVLDGPISPFVTATLRYGGQMARFLPALMLTPDWSMTADIHAGWLARDGTVPILTYQLDGSSGLVSHYKASAEFDSRLEANFAAEFEEKLGRQERKWILAREDEIVPVGDTVMIPDFSFTHVKDGRRALVELAGFWHPDYLERKARKLRAADRRDLIVVAYKSVNTTDATWQDVPGEVLLFSSKPVIKDVLAAVERCAVRKEEIGD